MGLVYDGLYRMSSVRLGHDTDDPLGLDETVVPGGLYLRLRLRLRGTAPEVDGPVGLAFDVLFAHAGHDAARPHIEHCRREGEVDCLVPIAPPADHGLSPQRLEAQHGDATGPGPEPCTP